MTTEPKAEGVEAVNPLDSLAWELSRFPMAAIVRALDKAIPGFAASYLRPAEVTPSAVEALARAADAAVARCSCCHGTGKVELVGVVYECDAKACEKLRAALSHPEIAALLKGEKK